MKHSITLIIESDLEGNEVASLVNGTLKRKIGGLDVVDVSVLDPLEREAIETNIGIARHAQDTTTDAYAYNARKLADSCERFLGPLK